MRKRTSGIVTSLRAVVFAGALAASAVVGTPSHALAHSVLASSDPQDGATLSESPRTTKFTFFDGIQQSDATVVLRAPNGETIAANPVRVEGKELIGTFPGTDLAGSYVAEYRYISLDGDAGRGEIRFVVDRLQTESETRSATDTIVPEPVALQTTTATPTSIAELEAMPRADRELSRSTETNAVLLGLVAVVLIASAVALGTALRRRR